MGMRLLGRGDELDDIDRRLHAGRLVTLIGPGGVGKTALADEAVARAAARFALGSRRVDLTRVDDAGAVPGALAAQLGFESFQALLDAPGDRKVLLMVDNCEHLLESAAHTIGRILEVCEQPTVLATSRSPLELPGESVVAVAPLAVPAVGAPRPPGVAGSGTVPRARPRRRRADRGCRPRRRCRPLPPAGRAPARARDRRRPRPDDESRRDRRPSPPGHRRARSAPIPWCPRHRSVAETIRWSYDLLGKDERDLLEHLAVFAGPFDADAARRVAGLDGQDQRFDALVDELVHASLMVADTFGASTRYRLLESVRRFALAQLESAAHATHAFDRFVDQALQRPARDPARLDHRVAPGARPRDGARLRRPGRGAALVHPSRR